MGEPRGPIFLVGFMGTGKTTIGGALARLLRWDFVDMDARIAEQERRSISSIFGQEGEAYFRRLEIGVLESLRGRLRLVVACGGGIYAQSSAFQMQHSNIYENSAAIMGGGLYVVGDLTSAAGPGHGLMAPRVGVAAHHQACAVLRLLLGLSVNNTD